jgi:hypothetical protein
MVRQLIADRTASFSRQGAVVKSWRHWRGRRHGPFYRLAFRDDTGRQRSIYLGADEGLAAAVRQTLAELQAPMRQHRWLEEVRRKIRRELRACRAAMNVELQAMGLFCKGAEIRGWRNARLDHGILG